jgi:catechol 2,3-dioxygenase-like lactoylglutathione lyase family enzyme
MSSPGASGETSTEIPQVGTVDMKLEVVTLPVSDVDRAKRFYQRLGWRLDADFAATAMEPGCLDRLLLQEVTTRLPGRVWED